MMALLGVALLAITARTAVLSWHIVVEAACVSWLVMLGATYVVPQVLYRKTEGRWVLPMVPAFRACWRWPVRPLVALLRFFQSVVDLGGLRATAEDAEPPPRSTSTP